MNLTRDLPFGSPYETVPFRYQFSLRKIKHERRNSCCDQSINLTCTSKNSSTNKNDTERNGMNVRGHIYEK